MKKILTFILLLFIGFTFSSCMMMMPDHMSGSMHENHDHDHAGMKVDPVCGKYVDEANSFTYEYKEKKYYFETEQCMSVFKNDPDHFIQKQVNDKQRKSWATAGMIVGGVAMTTMMVLMMVAIF
jgi:YHS domain-containing protein